MMTILAGACKDKLSPSEKLEKSMEKFSAYMVDKSIFADCKDGFPYILQAIKLAASGLDYYSEIEPIISDIEKRIKKSSILDPIVLEMLHIAYSLTHEKKELNSLKELIPQVSMEEYFRNKIAEAIIFFQNGSADKTVQILVEIAILTVTPIP